MRRASKLFTHREKGKQGQAGRAGQGKVASWSVGSRASGRGRSRSAPSRNGEWRGREGSGRGRGREGK